MELLYEAAKEDLEIIFFLKKAYLPTKFKFSSYDHFGKMFQVLKAVGASSPTVEDAFVQAVEMVRSIALSNFISYKDAENFTKLNFSSNSIPHWFLYEMVRCKFNGIQNSALMDALNMTRLCNFTIKLDV